MAELVKPQTPILYNALKGKELKSAVFEGRIPLLKG
jgi:hypothetical protein